MERRPLWQFDHDLMRVQADRFDIVYMPHKQKALFDLGPGGLFYKRSPLPGLFTVDGKGWGGGLSYAGAMPVPQGDTHAVFAHYTALAADNRSTISQPPIETPFDERDYDLFICQVPHDEAILQNADVTVAQALTAVIAFCATQGRRLLVKGHPANPKSMKPLAAIAQAAGVGWIDGVSIHRCLSGANMVYMVNSGSGFEAILHGKPVIAFGRAEYSGVVATATPDTGSIAQVVARQVDHQAYRNFIAGYVDRCVDVDDDASYATVERAIVEAGLAA